MAVVREPTGGRRGRRLDLAVRAALVHSGLRRLWGDEPPPAPDPELALLTDAVSLDDEAGIRSGLVVQSDALSVECLARLVSAPGGAEGRLLELPEPLRGRVAEAFARSLCGH
jgi:hypothetical protein